MTEKPIYISGDSHGRFSELFIKIDKHDIKDCWFISLGDDGFGFVHPEKQMRQFKDLNNRFKKRGIMWMGVRGNHQDPSYHKGENRVVLSNMELLDDYTYKTINGEKFLFVGGAISVDRAIRTLNMSYWSDEVFVLDESKIEKCDVLISHSAPNWVGPNTKNGIHYWCERDPSLWDECVAERLAHNRLVELCQSKRSYHGHFHEYHVAEHNGTTATILEELGIVEHR
jgi:hypothetical protein